MNQVGQKLYHKKSKIDPKMDPKMNKKWKSTGPRKWTQNSPKMDSNQTKNEPKPDENWTKTGLKRDTKLNRTKNEVSFDSPLELKKRARIIEARQRNFAYVKWLKKQVKLDIESQLPLTTTSTPLTNLVLSLLCSLCLFSRSFSEKWSKKQSKKF